MFSDSYVTLSNDKASLACVDRDGMYYVHGSLYNDFNDLMEIIFTNMDKLVFCNVDDKIEGFLIESGFVLGEFRDEIGDLKTAYVLPANIEKIPNYIKHYQLQID
ncbi:MAG: hypothetical protein JEY94_19185 [Melioribacteraceae bacterium]|nr:hypothetical protein [Melioribacteraceae bacterium]